ncbi:riboflavin kinase [Corynebacterium sp.]|jgi:FAD synthase|uniref:riboflavin kinase n=1 Tax=Corynebacterium sp. TaxID=1720 RepID=UPI0025BF32DF|nr:riboflavin kinase [Corynebacterium sp.]
MHIVTGTVEHGDKRGRELGFPTANIAVTGLTPDQEVELSGVWAGVAEDRSTGESLTVTVSMGRRPTFYGPEGVFLLEAFVLDFPAGHSKDLYGRELAVHLCERLRGQLAFDTVEELIECMDNDVARTREWAADASCNIGVTGR